MEALLLYHDWVAARVGERSRRRVGVIDAKTISRYALAIGEMDAVHHDVAAAKAAGFDNVVAPPNLLAAVAEWGTGSREGELSPDGIARDWSSDTLRFMGAGEDMELLLPVTAGVDLYDEEVIEKVELKQGRSGDLVFVTTMHEFVDATGVVFNRNRRTVLARA